MFLLALAASALFSTRLEGLGPASAQRLNSGWSYLQDQEFAPVPTLPCTLEKSGETLLLQHDLTERELYKEYILAIRTRYASIRAWANEALIYDQAVHGEEHALGSMWHFIPMSRCENATLLTIELRTYDGENSWKLESVLLDTSGAIRYTLLKDNIGAIFFSFICLILTLIILFCVVVMVRRKSQAYVPLLSLALFMFLSGLWILLDSKINTIWGGNYALSYFLSYAAFFLLPAPFLMYMRLMLKDGQRGLSILIWALILNAGLCITLHMADLVRIRDTAVLVHVLILLAIPVSTRAFWRSVVQRRERQLRFTFFGMLAVYVCGLVSILLYHLGRLQTANNTSLYILGLSILLAGMTADALAFFGQFWRQKESADRYRRLAVEDSMTSLGNRNAFQLRMANLLKSPPEQLAFIVFDVDNLKMINDQFGHHVGDQAIYLAAQCIHAIFAPVGPCYRIGGDEFTVVVTGKAINRIPVLLAGFMQQLDSQWKDLPVRTGVSYGWSCARFTSDAPLTSKQLLQLRKEADHSLYRLKYSRKQGKASQPAKA